MNWKSFVGLLYGAFLMSIVAHLLHDGITDVASLKIAAFGDKGLVQRQKIPGTIRSIICLIGMAVQGDTIPEYIQNLAHELGIRVPDGLGTAVPEVADTAVNV